MLYLLYLLVWGRPIFFFKNWHILVRWSKCFKQIYILFYYWHFDIESENHWFVTSTASSFSALNRLRGAVKSVSVASVVRAWLRSLSLSPASFISHLDHGAVEAQGWRRGGAVSRGSDRDRCLCWGSGSNLSAPLCSSLQVGLRRTSPDTIFSSCRPFGSIQLTQVHNGRQTSMTSPRSLPHGKH